MEYTGIEFNQKYKDVKFVKLTNETENHNNYQFKTGLNIDTVKFRPEGTCKAGGIYFIRVANIVDWLSYNDKVMKYIRDVTVPDDAKVFDEGDKFKADKLVLSERRETSDYYLSILIPVTFIYY